MKKQAFSVMALIFIVLSFNANSQQWKSFLPKDKSPENQTFNDHQKAFYEYWAPFDVENGYYFKDGVKKKAFGWKQFKRWEYEMEGKVDPKTGAFPKKTAQQVVDEFYSNRKKTNAKNSDWTSLGPGSSDGGYAGVGRINCVAFHPSDNNTYWIGAPAGGIWQTTDNGANWTCLTNDNAVLGIADIVIPSDFATSNTIYIATGDRDAWDNRSIGVLKSTDGGATWNTTGLSYNLSDNSMVYRLLLDPSDNQTLIAATSGGVYKTTDGGTTWSNKISTNQFIDMEYKPGNFDVLYGSNQSGSIYTTTDGGGSWSQSLNLSAGKRIELAVSPNEATWVYAVVADGDSGLYGIYKSTNSGGSFSQVFSGSTKNLLGWNADGNDTGGQGWYDLSLASSPTDANVILVGGINTWRSTDGGANWAIVSHWSGAPVTIHADKHQLNFRSNGSLFECNDGGVYISTDNGTSWTDKTNGMVISQMYKLSNSATVANEVITGLQDNGSKLLSGGQWYDVSGGDGMECLIDYSDVNIQYATYTNGQIYRTTNHWSSNTQINPSAAGDGAWVTPYIIDPTDPKTLYAGYSDVYKTTDRGDNWTKISTMNTSNKIRSMAIASSNTQVLYVADSDQIWKTTNGGTSWSDVTGTLPVGSGSLTYIAVKEDDPNTVWVTLSGYFSGTVYQTVDGGTNWTNISSGLPSIPAYTIVQNKRSSSDVQLYVGTEVGIYFKKGSEDWTLYSTGLPNVRIGELEIYYGTTDAESKLRAATYGRGLWESPIYYASTNMEYQSCTTIQNNTATIAPGQTNQDIIAVQIVTNGNLNPLSATSFSFSTLGSTDVADISNAKLYYTGTSNIFGTNTQVGSTISAPDGAFTITGTQELADGTNYFWLSYDVPASATIGNVLDAQCSSVTVVDAKTPTVTDPAGNRSINIEYCDAGSSASSYEYISNVNIGTIDQASNRGTNSYEDYTSASTDVLIGQENSFTVTVASSYSTDQVLIWVDLNKNGDFTDNGENVYASTGDFSSPKTGTFTIPDGTLTGETRMRIRLHDTDNGPNTSPCGNSSYGEVEDYTLNIKHNGPAAGGTATASETDVCVGSKSTLTLSGHNGTIQWQQSATSTTGFTDIVSANAETYEAEPTQNTYYRAKVYIDTDIKYSNEVSLSVRSLPVPDFSFVNDKLSVDFTNTSTNATSYLWRFGDDETSTGTSPTHEYAKALSFTPKLIAYNDYCADSLTKTLDLTDVAIAPTAESDADGVCEEKSFGLSVSGYYNGDLQWQKSATSGSGFADINQATGESESVDAISESTYYRLKIATTSETVYSNEVFVELYASPLPSYTYNANYLEVTFTNTSTGAVSYLWDFDDTYTSTDANPVHIFGTSGSYNVKLTAETADGCVDFATEQLVLSSVAIADLGGNVQMKIYPNPTKGKLFFELNNPQQRSLEVKIVNLQGKIVFESSKMVETQEINLKNLPKGIYQVQIVLENKQVTKTIVLQ